MKHIPFGVRLRPHERVQRQRSRLTFVDQLVEAWLSMRAHPIRSLATSLGVVLGVAAAVATISLTETAKFQVAARFNRLRASQVDVTADPQYYRYAGGVTGDSFVVSRGAQPVFTADALTNASELSGVEAVGAYSEVEDARPAVSLNRHPAPGLGASPRVVGVDNQLLAAAGAESSGGSITEWEVANRSRVAMLGRRLADELGVDDVTSAPAVFVDGLPFLVVGIVEDGGRLPTLDDAVVLPLTTQLDLLGGGHQRLLVRVRQGAAPAIAETIPYAIDPAKPQRFEVTDPADPTRLRRAVGSDLSSLGVFLALVSTAVGVIGIGSSTWGAIYERLGEFGLRRSLGARGGHLGRHVLTECVVVGTFAGLAGTVVGLAVAVGSAAARGWTPIIHPLLPVLAPALGVASGVLAGLLPAWKAGRIEPAEALRR